MGLDVLAVGDIRVGETEVGQHKVNLSGVKAGRAQLDVAFYIRKKTEPSLIDAYQRTIYVDRCSLQQDN